MQFFVIYGTILLVDKNIFSDDSADISCLCSFAMEFSWLATIDHLFYDKSMCPQQKIEFRTSKDMIEAVVGELASW